MTKETKLANARRNYARNRATASRRRLSYWGNVIYRIMGPKKYPITLEISGVEYVINNFTNT